MPKKIKANPFKLSPQQIAVAAGIADGLPLKDIATKLKMSINTCRVHANLVRAKIGAASIYQAASILNRQ